MSAGTRLLALLGDPVSHSLSPTFQNAAFREAGVDGVYVALRCAPDDVAALMGALARGGGGGNVTLPHKERAAAVVERPSEAVLRTGACNTFWGDDAGRIHGDNTDVEGFRRALRRMLPEPRGSRVLLLGAGGAARAALLALAQEEVGEVVLLNRTLSRARTVAGSVGDGRVQVASGADEVAGEAFDLAVNATSLGLSPEDPLPLHPGRVGRLEAVLDLVYGPRETAFVRAARAAGIPAADGAEMLVQQGAVAFERWWDRPAPVEAMRSALDEARATR